MEYGSFFFGSLAFLVLLAGGVWRLHRSRRGSPVWRARTINAALVLLALLVPLVAAEGCFLFFIDATDGPMQSLTARRWAQRHLPQPQGSPRGRFFPSADTANRRYVAVIGDSITYGQGIERDEDIYTSIVERDLRARGIPVDVFNISFMGWNTTHELEELRWRFESGARYNTVVLAFCFNDIGDHVHGPPGFSEAVLRLKRPPALLIPLLNHSFVVSFFYSNLVALTEPVIKRTWDSLADAYRQTLPFSLLTAQFKRFKDLTDFYGAGLVVLTIPSTTVPWARYAERDIHRKLDAYWKGIGVSHIDLLPVFERYPPRSLMVNILDSHPNELAHRLIASTLVDALTGPLNQPPPPLKR